MIVSDLSRVRDQVVLTPNMEKALEFLSKKGQDVLPVGRAIIDGDLVYAEVQAYDTIEGENNTFEGHRKYIDIQYVVSGDEIIGWVAIDDVTESSPFVEEYDYWLATAEAKHVTEVKLHGGQLAVLYPEDMHAPRRAARRSSPGSKLVVKVAIDQ